MTDRSTPLTLRDLAIRAGVSTAAVSNALSGKGRMSAENRERIQQLARELGYRPNAQAASLRTGLSKNIGFVMTPDSDPDSEKRWAAYSSHLLYALVLEAGAQGYTVTIVSARHPELLANAHIDALFYFDPVRGETLIDQAQKLHIPVLSNDQAQDSRLSVVVDSGFEDMTRAAFDYLHAQGAQKPGLLTEIPGIASDEVAENVYVQWCAEHNITPRIARGNYGRTDVAKQLDSLIAQGCDAIYSFYEEAELIVQELHNRNISIPDDLLFIAATVSREETEHLGVTATVYHTDQAPARAFHALIESSRNPEGPPVTVRLPWEFVEGTSARRL